MTIKIKYISKYIFSFLFLVSATMQAQITIGTLEPPARGALLEIKDIDPVNPDVNNVTSTTGGLLLPRVELKDLKTLEPFVEITDLDYENQKKLHSGMMVFNIVPNTAKKLYKGIYSWSGIEWLLLVSKSTKFALETSSSELIFETGSYTSGVVNPQNLTIDWLPATASCNVEYAHLVNDGIPEFTPPPVLAGGGAGQEVLTIVPNAIPQAILDEDPFYERSSRMKLTLEHNSEYKEAYVSIKQINYAISFADALTNGTMGQAYSWKVACNSDWVATITGDADIFSIKPPTSGGYDIIGEDFSFTMTNSDNKTGESATITFSSPSGLFPSESFTITAQKDLPNSFIVAHNSSVTFSIRKAYQIWREKLATTLPSTGLSVELTWQDEKSLISNVTLSNAGADSEITVNTSNITKDGNALVSLKINGAIKWSWLIWVTNYNPGDNPTISVPEGSSGSTTVAGGHIWSYFNGKNTTHFMDRNLGAKETSIAFGAQSCGNYYQYGSAIPYVGIQSLATLSVRTLYNISDGVLARPASIKVSVIDNLQNVIENPLQFYFGDPNSYYDWRSTKFGVSDPYAWRKEDNTKGLFDPCPLGWQIASSGLSYDNPWNRLQIKHQDSGCNWETEGAGKWPYVGFINYFDGAYANIATGYYATTQLRQPNNISIMSVSNGMFRPLYVSPKATAHPIRCVKQD